MSENKKTRRKEYIGFLFHYQHYNLISITAPLSHLRGKANRVWRHSRCVCLNPLLCLLIKRRAGVKTHYFLHASPLPGSSSPGDLENVCSPKRLPLPSLEPLWAPTPHPIPGKSEPLRAGTGHKYGYDDGFEGGGFKKCFK